MLVRGAKITSVLILNKLSLFFVESAKHNCNHATCVVQIYSQNVPLEVCKVKSQMY